MPRPKLNHRNKQDGAKTPPAPRALSPRARDLWICALLLLSIFIVYGQTAYHDFLNYDDPDYVNDPHVRGGLNPSGIEWAFSSGYSSNSFPLTWISHMADYQIFGGRSGPPHLVNVVLHAAGALLLFAFLRRATGAAGRSAFAAFMLALHPLHVESVAWIAERKDILCAFFWMWTLWAYGRYAAQPSARWYAAVLALFCCGLLSKPMMVTFPFAALLLDRWPLRRFSRPAARGLVLEKLPMIALSLCVSVIAYVAQQHQGAVAAVDQIPLTARLGNALVGYVAYLWDFIWPAGLAVFYPYFEHPVWQVLAAALFLAALTAVVIRTSPRRPYLAMGWFWYLGTLVPVIGLVQIGAQSRADRYTYIPLIGISFIVAWGAAELFEKWKWNRRVVAAVAAGVCLAWAAITFADVQYWRDSLTLFTRALAVTNGNYVAYNNVAVALRQQGKIPESSGNFEQVVALRPDDPQAQDNLGETLTAGGRIEEALPHLRIAVKLQPGYAKAHIDLGSALFRAGNLNDAEKEYQIAVQLQPSDSAAEYGLGSVLLALGRQQQGIAYLQKAAPLLAAEVIKNPEDVDGHFNLGILYGMLGQTDDAIAQFSQAIRLRPDDPQARFNLGIALASRNRLNEAVDQFEQTIRLAPDDEAAHFSLGNVLAALGRNEQAAREYEETLRLNPQRQDARRSLDALHRASAR